MNNFSIDHIVEKFGTQIRLANEIDVSQSTVAHWKKRGAIPARQQRKILNAARRLQIDITPNDFFEIEELGNA